MHEIECSKGCVCVGVSVGVCRDPGLSEWGVCGALRCFLVLSVNVCV